MKLSLLTIPAGIVTLGVGALWFSAAGPFNEQEAPPLPPTQQELAQQKLGVDSIVDDLSPIIVDPFGEFGRSEDEEDLDQNGSDALSSATQIDALEAERDDILQKIIAMGDAPSSEVSDLQRKLISVNLKLVGLQMESNSDEDNAVLELDEPLHGSDESDSNQNQNAGGSSISSRLAMSADCPECEELEGVLRATLLQLDKIEDPTTQKSMIADLLQEKGFPYRLAEDKVAIAEKTLQDAMDLPETSTIRDQLIERAQADLEQKLSDAEKVLDDLIKNVQKTLDDMKQKLLDRADEQRAALLACNERECHKATGEDDSSTVQKVGEDGLGSGSSQQSVSPVQKVGTDTPDTDDTASPELMKKCTVLKSQPVCN